MQSWKLTGIIATAVIILSIPLYLLRVIYLDPREGNSTKNHRPVLWAAKSVSTATRSNMTPGWIPIMTVPWTWPAKRPF